jgi:hypothetical protein
MHERITWPGEASTRFAENAPKSVVASNKEIQRSFINCDVKTKQGILETFQISFRNAMNCLKHLFNKCSMLAWLVTDQCQQTLVATGAQDENRTHDLRITSALLYRLSYLGG